ncbi:MAG TPA: diguanylate cyclase, partial [Gemmataceae bacterium]|nr:diguanylate cyclase [Gemmataceae bacterium]
LRRAIAERPFEFEGQPYPITVSVGIGTIPIGHWVTPADLLREADGRLYEAKRAGRNRVAPAAPVGLSSSVPTPVARAQPPEQPGEA